jgi:1,4-alpha-glucan branching enzyme/maltooligosyltrehalose trehalohydrolase
VPRIARPQRGASFTTVGEGGIAIDWTLGDGAKLHLRANFGDAPVSGMPVAAGEALFSTGSNGDGELGAWGGTWTLEVKG